MSLTMPILIDPGSKVIRSYGILNEDHGEIPHPSAFVIDREGIIRFKRMDEDYKMRPAADDLLAALGAK